MFLFSFFASFLEKLLSLKHIHSKNHAPLELYCISNNECGDFTVILKLETVYGLVGTVSSPNHTFSWAHVVVSLGVKVEVL